MVRILDNNLLISFYGDDFTGSTDVMESLSLNGIPAALFLDPPAPEEINNFRLKNPLDIDADNRIKAFGVAGISRSLSPDQMDKELNPIFEKICKIPTDFFHYKVCSTFDSSPVVGSIGHATEIAMKYFPSDYIPLVVGAPSLNRFCIFGNLFARAGNVTYRLDRHPTMSKHPITPMTESDLCIHLGLQTKRKIELFDIFSLQQSQKEQQKILREFTKNPGSFILFDTVDQRHLLETGKIIVKNRSEKTQLLIGSSGTEYALTAYLKDTGKIHIPDYPTEAGKQDQILIMAGSAAPTTKGQIEWCISQGFYPLRINTINAVDPQKSSEEKERIYNEAIGALNENKSVVIFSALGPDDPNVNQTKELLNKLSTAKKGVLASFQGESLRQILETSKLKRMVVAGGDTSGYVSRALEIYALEIRIPVAPGAPLCTAHSKNPSFDGLEISLKGGQNGNDRYFESILKGKKLE